MSEIKLEAKQWGHSENLALRKFHNVCEIFAMSKIFFTFSNFFLKNKIK